MQNSSVETGKKKFNPRLLFIAAYSHIEMMWETHDNRPQVKSRKLEKSKPLKKEKKIRLLGVLRSFLFIYTKFRPSTFFPSWSKVTSSNDFSSSLSSSKRKKIRLFAKEFYMQKKSCSLASRDYNEEITLHILKWSHV